MKRRTARQRDREAEGTTETLGGWEGFAARMRAEAPPELLETVMASFAADKPLVVRLHGPDGDTLAQMESLGWAPSPLGGGSRAFRVTPPGGERRAITDSALVRSGHLYIQNPSSLLPGLALRPEGHHAVLDLCAAPGGKTLHLVDRMGSRDGEGTLSAVEAVRGRFFKLRGLLERYGATHVRTYLKDARAVGPSVPERFDRVLVDAPCSSEARIDPGDPASFAQWSPRKVRECQHKQLGILRSGLAALKPGGRLIYCTCSFSRDENEGVVAATLDTHEGAVRLVETGLDALGFTPPAALRPGHHEGDPRLALTRRVWPDGLWDGFFIAAFEKSG